VSANKVLSGDACHINVPSGQCYKIFVPAANQVFAPQVSQKGTLRLLQAATVVFVEEAAQ
jgi:hypothetical protein